MNLETVKDTIYDTVDMFFKGATVIWSEQITTKPPLPYVTLKLGGIKKTTFPITDDEGNRYYPCSTVLEVNLYTKGKQIIVGENVTGNYQNTATSDMLDFFKFLESDEIIDYLAGKGLDILLVPPIRDLTELQNDSRYRYRSMAEATVSWSEEANGLYGIGSMATVPNSSGGGTAIMQEAETNTIEEVEIKEITEGGTENDEE